MKTALNTIRAEHRALSAVIHGLQYLVNQVGKGGPPPDPQVFHAMVQYIDHFPERLHHPKEDKYLFALLRQRTPEANAVLDDLEAQHVRGAKLIRDLEWAMLNWEDKGMPAFAEFAQKVGQYAEFHWRHMRQEEDVVLPLAERVLTAEDWKALDAAFEGNQDPLIGIEMQQDFDKLFSRIVNLAPPPIGLGPEPEAPAGTRR